MIKIDKFTLFENRLATLVYINLEMVNWEIYLVNNLTTLLSLQISSIWGN